MGRGKRVKILVAKPGLDGHDVGAKILVRAFMDAGFEVLYTGLRKSPEQIANIACEEDVDVIGLSILSGSHLPLCRALKPLLDENGLDDKLWIVGGNIPKKDIESLKAIGVDAVFPGGTGLKNVISYVREKVV